MTLILTIANSAGVYQSSDYQLTAEKTGRPISDRAGSKQLNAKFQRLELQLAFTGVASIGNRRTIDFLLRELRALPHDTDLQRICASLRKSSATAISPLSPRRPLTLVIGVSAVAKPFRVAVISNTDWSEMPPRVKRTFDVSIKTIKKPFHLISGYRDSVPPIEINRLKALARTTSKSPNEIADELAAINAIAARPENGRGYISAGCCVASLYADRNSRRSHMRSFGEQGSVPILIGGFDLVAFVRQDFRAAPGQELRLMQTAGVILAPGEATPLPPPQGDPRQFLISGGTLTSILRPPSGEECGSVQFTQLSCTISARRNEAVTVPFANVQFRGGLKIPADFPRPLLPWSNVSPDLALDGIPIPRGWQYAVGYWIEHGLHNAEIPDRSSRSIRNLAFLGDDDELVITVRSSSSRFNWSPAEDGPATTFEAEIMWRDRLDGTRG